MSHWSPAARQGSAPTGPAGGDLAGDYPDPNIGVSLALIAAPGDDPVPDDFFGQGGAAEGFNFLATTGVFGPEDGTGDHAGLSCGANVTGDETENVYVWIKDAASGAIQAMSIDTTGGIDGTPVPDTLSCHFEGGVSGVSGSFKIIQAVTDYSSGPPFEHRIGFFNTLARIQGAAIDAPSGGTIVDTQARTAIEAILNLLSAAAGGYGLTA